MKVSDCRRSIGFGALLFALLCLIPVTDLPALEDAGGKDEETVFEPVKIRLLNLDLGGDRKVVHYRALLPLEQGKVVNVNVKPMLTNDRGDDGKLRIIPNHSGNHLSRTRVCAGGEVKSKFNLVPHVSQYWVEFYIWGEEKIRRFAGAVVPPSFCGISQLGAEQIGEYWNLKTSVAALKDELVERTENETLPQTDKNEVYSSLMERLLKKHSEVEIWRRTSLCPAATRKLSMMMPTLWGYLSYPVALKNMPPPDERDTDFHFSDPVKVEFDPEGWHAYLEDCDRLLLSEIMIHASMGLEAVLDQVDNEGDLGGPARATEELTRLKTLGTALLELPPFPGEKFRVALVKVVALADRALKLLEQYSSASPEDLAGLVKESVDLRTPYLVEGE